MTKTQLLTKACLLGLLFVALGQSAWSEEEATTVPIEMLAADGLSGTVVDAKTRKPVPYAVVSVAWALQPRKGVAPAGQHARVKVLQQYANKDGKFSFEGWKEPRPTLERGWEIVPGRDPMVRIYAQGYQRVDIANVTGGKHSHPFNAPGAKVLKWVGQGKAQAMKPLSAGQAALETELRLWRKDLDEEIQAVGVGREKTRAMNSQGKLLVLFADQCKKLDDEQRSKICYPTDSDVAKHIEADAEERANTQVYDLPDGEKQVTQHSAVPANPETTVLGTHRRVLIREPAAPGASPNGAPGAAPNASPSGAPSRAPSGAPAVGQPK